MPQMMPIYWLLICMLVNLFIHFFFSSYYFNLYFYSNLSFSKPLKIHGKKCWTFIKGN